MSNSHGRLDLDCNVAILACLWTVRGSPHTVGERERARELPNNVHDGEKKKNPIGYEPGAWQLKTSGA